MDRSSRLETLAQALTSAVIALQDLQPGEMVVAAHFGAYGGNEANGYYYTIEIHGNRVIDHPQIAKVISVGSRAHEEQRQKSIAIVVAAYNEAVAHFSIPPSGRH